MGLNACGGSDTTSNTESNTNRTETSKASPLSQRIEAKLSNNKTYPHNDITLTYKLNNETKKELANSRINWGIESIYQIQAFDISSSYATISYHTPGIFNISIQLGNGEVEHIGKIEVLLPPLNCRGRSETIYLYSE